MSTRRGALLALWLLATVAARAQTERRDPHMGYLYPAGGRAGDVVLVTVGGQNLRGVSAVHLTGTGVQAKVLRHYPPLRNLDPEQREALAARFHDLVEQRWAELHKAGRVGPTPPWGALGLRRPARRGRDASASPPAELPAHPLLYDLEHKSLRELLHVRTLLASLRKGGQTNPQIAESVLLEVTVARDAPLGERELRLRGPLGLTNPLTFEVGALREFGELETNDPGFVDPLPPEPPLETPIALNGQITPGDVDRFRFRATQGQRLVIETHARRLIPYLADAVPGWFQATVAVYGADGQELAFADDYRFDPDPVLCYDVPADGEYELEIRDALYRGRQDFVYRVLLGERPFITSLFPLGGRAGQSRYVSIEGWNLPTDRLFLDAESGADGIRQRCLGLGRHTSNRVAYALDPLPAENEIEPNDTPAAAQRIVPGRIVNGRIGTPGDSDVYRFRGKRGDRIVAEVVARRVNSPLDALVRLTDASGAVLAWNDDFEHKDGVLHPDDGVLTHSADSLVRAELPADGEYCVSITDAQGAGGSAYGYRLRIGPPRPDFALRVTPSALNVPAGGSIPLTAFALRKDGFDGPIELVLRDAAAGLRLAGARVPAGRDRIQFTLSAPLTLRNRVLALVIEGRATINGRLVTHTAVPADDVEQAFLYRHLVPAGEALLAVLGGRLAAAEQPVVRTAPVRIPSGGTAEVRIGVPARLLARQPEFVLHAPPSGITLVQSVAADQEVVLTLKADAEKAPPGTTDNLIIEVFATFNRPQRGGGEQPQRTALGFLPAVPVEITGP